jgi:hypothetical protein
MPTDELRTLTTRSASLIKLNDGILPVMGILLVRTVCGVFHGLALPKAFGSFSIEGLMNPSLVGGVEVMEEVESSAGKSKSNTSPNTSEPMESANTVDGAASGVKYCSKLKLDSLAGGGVTKCVSGVTDGPATDGSGVAY